MHRYLQIKYNNKFKQSFVRNDLRGSDRHGPINGRNGNEVKRFVGKDLKKIRKKYNISQRCFAEMLGISIKTLQNYEIGHRSMPSTAVSVFIFADENIALFRKYYLTRVKDLKPYRDSMN